MTKSKAEIESLKLAIKTEEDGHKMYTDAAERVTNPLAKSTFTALAKEELHHISAIKKFYNYMKTGEGEISTEEYEQAMSYELRKKTIFEAAKDRIEKTVSADPDTMEAYNAALKFEEDGAKMYEELAEKTDDFQAKTLYSFLYEQENEHYRFLQESIHYLENPDQWFFEQERPHFEG